MELEYWRPSRDEYFLAMASLVSLRSTCRRVASDVYLWTVIAMYRTGYNGVAAGQPHCIDKACPGAATRRVRVSNTARLFMRNRTRCCNAKTQAN